MTKRIQKHTYMYTQSHIIGTMPSFNWEPEVMQTNAIQAQTRNTHFKLPIAQPNMVKGLVT